MIRLKLQWSSGPRAGTVLEVSTFPFAIGRSVQCDLSLGEACAEVSGVHLRFCVVNGVVCVEDQNSTNGTFVNERRVTGASRIGERDVIGMGRTGPRIMVVADPRLAEDEGASRPARGLDATVAAIRPAASSTAAPKPSPAQPVKRLASTIRSPTQTAEVPSRRPIGEATMVRHVEAAIAGERRRGRKLMLGVLAAVAAGAGAAWWWFDSFASVQEVARRYEASIWSVCTKSSEGSYELVGTAWTVRGGLATSASVADRCDGAVEKVVARALRAGVWTEVGIVLVDAHPHRREFTDLLRQYKPVVNDALMESKGQFEVAVLRVSSRDTEKLGTPIPIASSSGSTPEAMEGLYSLGFSGARRTKSPGDFAVVGALGKCLHSTDSFDGVVRQMADVGLMAFEIENSAGASGCPIINLRGEVVAVLCTECVAGGGGVRATIGYAYGAPAWLVDEVVSGTAPYDRLSVINQQMRGIFNKTDYGAFAMSRAVDEERYEVVGERMAHGPLSRRKDKSQRLFGSDQPLLPDLRKPQGAAKFCLVAIVATSPSKDVRSLFTVAVDDAAKHEGVGLPKQIPHGYLLRYDPAKPEVPWLAIAASECEVKATWQWIK
jgi:hypothetical protein